jgi:hypothetical protein
MSSKFVLERLAILEKMTLMMVRMIKSNKNITKREAMTSAKMLDQSAIEALSPIDTRSFFNALSKYSIG